LSGSTASGTLVIDCNCHQTTSCKSFTTVGAVAGTVMAETGPVHTLIVNEVGEQDESEFADYEIEHPAECKTEHDDMLDCERYVCAVAFNVDNVGLRWAMHYSGSAITEPGTYKIQAWAETYRGFDFVEHDSGIGLVQPEPEVADAVDA
jgi:hypothetical protein